MFFLLFAAWSLYICWLDSRASLSGGIGWSCPSALGILLISVLLHEMGHVIVAAHLGGNTDEIIIGPLGGLGQPPSLLEPQCELVTAITGPIVNLAICVVTSILLCLQGNVDVAGLMNPFSPASILEGSSVLVKGLKLTFWINWLLVVVNVIPAFPFDGARAVRSIILTGWPQVDPRAAALLTVRLAKVTSAVLVILAILTLRQVGNPWLPSWFALLLLGIFVFFSARNEEKQPARQSNEDLCLGYDFSEGYTSLERSVPPSSTTRTETAETGPVTGWLQRRRELRERRLRESEALEDGRVDEILARLHEHGFSSLTAEERDILQRASARYQKRKSE
jgi:Zn-dependent protease